MPIFSPKFEHKVENSLVYLIGGTVFFIYFIDNYYRFEFYLYSLL